jgi:hypothetical protein
MENTIKATVTKWMIRKYKKGLHDSRCPIGMTVCRAIEKNEHRKIGLFYFDWNSFWEEYGSFYSVSGMPFTFEDCLKVGRKITITKVS